MASVSRRPALRSWTVAALLFAATVLLFSRGIGNGFTNYDDPRYILNNVHVQTGFTWANLAWAFTGNADYWHPLTWLSHILDWSVYGNNASGHHLTSVLWHAVNAALAFAVLRRLTGQFWPSVFAAALFAVHPLRVESVAWITERKDVMSGCFFLLTLWAYAAYAKCRTDGRPARGAYLTALGLFALDLMCKPTVVTLPLVLLGLDFWPLGRLGSQGEAQSSPAAGLQKPTATLLATRTLLLEKLPFFALSAAAALTTVRMQQAVGAFTLDLPLGARLANVPVAIVRYLGKFFWPSSLAVCYPHPGQWPVGVVVGSVAIVGLLCLAAWQQRRTRPWILVGWCWFLALLAPVIGILQVGFQSMADRYTYLPMLGWGLVIAWTAHAWRPGRLPRAVTAGLAVVILLALSLRTWKQEAVWRDSEALFRHAIAVTDRNDVAEAFLGYTLASEGKRTEAKEHCATAVRLNPRNAMAIYTRAAIDGEEGRIDDAVAGYRQVLELTSTDEGARYELAILLLRQGQLPEAKSLLSTAVRRRPAVIPENLVLAQTNLQQGRIEQANLHFIAATILEPQNPVAWFGCGLTYLRADRDDQAAADFAEAIRLRPDYAAAQAELGFILLRRGEPDAAVQHLRSALAIEPKLTTARVGLGRAEDALGNHEQADACFRQALAEEPRDGEIQRAWAEILARRGDFGHALAAYRRSVELSPGSAESHAGLGYLLYLTGDRPGAAVEWREALRLNPHLPGLRERLDALTTGGGNR